MRLFLFLIVSPVLISFYACKKYKPATEAFYIKPNAVHVSTKINEGSGSHKITDLWIYVNGFYKGAYPVGSLLPIMSQGEAVSINVFAGIKNNGISNTRIFYPMYEFITLDTLVETGKTIERNFTFQYKASTTFTWNENFESSGYSIKKSDVSDVNYSVIKSEDSFEGKSLLMALNDTSLIAELQSSGIGFGLPTGSSNVYLEINYKCTEEFTIGLIGDNNYYKPAFTVNPSPEWNKIYIQLSSAVSTPPTSSKYKVYFRMLNKPSNPNPTLFLDNIKLVFL